MSSIGAGCSMRIGDGGQFIRILSVRSEMRKIMPMESARVQLRGIRSEISRSAMRRFSDRFHFNCGGSFESSTENTLRWRCNFSDDRRFEEALKMVRSQARVHCSSRGYSRFDRFGRFPRCIMAMRKCLSATMGRVPSMHNLHEKGTSSSALPIGSALGQNCPGGRSWISESPQAAKVGTQHR
jgi:hypothetical protein